MTDWLNMPLRAQSEAIAAGEISALELAEAHLARIDARNGDLRAVVHLNESLRAEAQAVDATPLEDRAPLAGLCFGVKDILDVAGQPTLCGSHAHPQSTHADAAAVAALRRAGMLVIGKLATYEYALTGPAYDQPYPPARNPWNLEHITGGSSSGSAAAVAGGLMRVALGTDTGGSIRAPSAYCGIIGLKPTAGLVPEAGRFPLSPSLDVIGPMAASVEDAALVLEALVPGHDASAEIGQEITGLTIGYARDWFAQDPAADPALIAGMDETAGLLSQLGARIELIDLPPYQPLEDAATVILQAEAYAIHRDGLAQRFNAYGVDARRNLMTGAVLTPEDVEVARAVGRSFADLVDQRLAHCAALLAPTTLGPAPAFADFADGPFWTVMRTMPFNLSGHPSISVPCGFTPKDLPLGAQLIGKKKGERTLCRIAHALEHASLHTARRA